MNIKEYFWIILLYALILISLFVQRSYLIKASINRIYRTFIWIVSFIVLIVTFFYYKSTYELIYGIINGILLFTISFMRNGITEKGLSSSQGNSCKWSKVNRVKLLKHKDKIKLVYIHSRGESYMYFDYSDYDKLLKVLEQFLSCDKINVNIKDEYIKIDYR